MHHYGAFLCWRPVGLVAGPAVSYRAVLMAELFSRLLMVALLLSLALNLWQCQLLSYSASINGQPAGQNASEVAASQTLQALFESGPGAVEADNPLAAEALLAFEQRRFVAAVQQFRALQREDPALAAQLKQQWLQTAMQWLDARDEAAVAELVDAFLRRYPYDLQFRELQAQLYITRGESLLAIEQYYALAQEADAADQRRYNEYIQALVEQQLAEYREAGQWRAALTFIERLLWFEPQYAAYLLARAEAHFQLGEYELARRVLYPLQYDATVANVVEELFARIARAEQPVTTVPLTRKGEHYLVAGIVDERYPVELMIDTGASLSVLSERAFAPIARRGRTSFVRQASISTAAGIVEAPVYRVESFQLGEYRIDDMLFVVMALEGAREHAGLLGMNFLREFDFRLDQQRSELLLDPR